ncbi:hypothetical protein MP228_011554 [Amoeboaphelidium protococcarum]|nr:hypothetical protein MP228_011554 [Amoeboaphelidium protococcarum]
MIIALHSVLLSLAVLISCLFSLGYGKLVTEDQLPLRTSGRWIVDSYGKRVKLGCINWHGAHMNTYAPSGLHFKSSKYIAQKIRSLGFNCVRLNWSLELVLRNPVVNRDAIKAMLESGRLDPSVQDHHALSIIDAVIEDLASEQVMVILDNHVSDPTWCCDPRDANGLWFNERYSAEDFERAWVLMAQRYAHEKYVIGTDLRNEIRPDIQFSVKPFQIPKVVVKLPGWNSGDIRVPLKSYAPEIYNYDHPDLTDIKNRALLFVFKQVIAVTQVEVYDWRTAATRVGNSIMKVNKNVMIIVQGLFDINAYLPNAVQLILYYLKIDPDLHRLVGKYFDIPLSVTEHEQIHNLTGIRNHPIEFGQSRYNINMDNRLVYSAHVYPFFYQGSRYSWNGTDPSYESYAQTLDTFWGYIFKESIAPLWVGETGNFGSARGLEPSWLNYNLRYLRENDLDFAYWPLADARPIIDSDGKFSAGGDEYALLNRDFSDLQYRPMYESFKDLFEPTQSEDLVESARSNGSSSGFTWLWDFASEQLQQVYKALTEQSNEFVFF